MVRQAMLARRTLTSNTTTTTINRDNPRVYRASLICIPSGGMKDPTTEMLIFIGHRRRQTSSRGYTKCTSTGNRNRNICPSPRICLLRTSTTWWQPLASQPLLSRRPPAFPQYQNFQQHQPYIFFHVHDQCSHPPEASSSYEYDLGLLDAPHPRQPRHTRTTPNTYSRFYHLLQWSRS